MPRPEQPWKGLSWTPHGYPELFAVVGGNTPNLQERTFWGSSSPGQYREAGLPNITGHFYSDFDNYYGCGGAIVSDSKDMVWFDRSHRGFMGIGFALDASLSSPVYGRSGAVQPAAYTVRFLIRAQP